MRTSKIVHKIASTLLSLTSFPSFFFFFNATCYFARCSRYFSIALGSLDFSVLIPLSRAQGQRSLGSVEPHDPLMWMISRVDELVYAVSFCGGSGEAI